MINYAAALALTKGLRIFSQDTGSIVPWIINDEQTETLEYLCSKKRVIVCKARQVGLTTLVSYYVAMCAFANPDTPICCVNYRFEESKGLLKKIKKFLVQLGVKFSVENTTQLVLENGSIIDALTAISPADGESKVGRGNTYKIIYCSEAAYYRDSQAVFASLSAAMTSGAQLILESTAVPGQTHFRTTWDEENNYSKLFFGVEDHAAYVADAAKISDDDWEMAQKKYSFTSRRHAAWWLTKLFGDLAGDDVRMRREYPVVEADAWTAASGRWISVDPKILPYLQEGKIKYFAPPNADHYYIIGVDPSGGAGGDDAVIIVYDMSARQIAAIMSDNTTTLDSLVNLAGILHAKYRAQTIYIEKNGIGAGATIMGKLANLPVTEFNTTEQTKYTGMLLARRWIECGGAADESLLMNAQSCRMELVGQKEKFSGKKDILMALGFCLRFAPDYDVIIAAPKVKVYEPNQFNASRIINNSRNRR